MGLTPGLIGVDNPKLHAILSVGMRLLPFKAHLAKYLLVVVAVAGIFFTQLPPVFSTTTYDPDTVMEPGGYKKGEEYVIKKSIEPPKSRHTDSSGYESGQIAHYQRKYKSLPPSFVAYLYKECLGTRGCKVDQVMATAAKDTARLLRRPTMWSKVKKQIIAYFAANLRASRAKRPTPTKGLLIAWLEKFAFWKKDNVAGEFVQKKIIEPTIVITKAITEAAVKTANNIVKNAQELGPPLLVMGKDNYYNRFIYSHDDLRIPSWSRAVFSWYYYWDPEINTDDPIQCVAFVAMTYNGAGKSLQDVKGDAKEWQNYTNKFNVYKSAESKTLPQKGDIMGWDDAPNGHVGIITDREYNKPSNNYKITVIQSNSYKVTTSYNMKKKPDGSYEITSSTDGATFIPDWWLRLKEFEK